MGGWRLAAVAFGALWLVAGGCSMQSSFDADTPDISAAHLGVPDRPTPAYPYLSLEEREALEAAGIATRIETTRAAGEVDDSPGAFPEETGEDKAGKAIMSVLTVGVTLGALAAPFFLF